MKESLTLHAIRTIATGREAQADLTRWKDFKPNSLKVRKFFEGWGTVLPTPRFASPVRQPTKGRPGERLIVIPVEK
jgi:hypothetical protein